MYVHVCISFAGHCHRGRRLSVTRPVGFFSKRTGILTSSIIDRTAVSTCAANSCSAASCDIPLANALALPRREYLCAGGARIVILVETKAARLTLNGHIYNMKQVETESGTKYAEGSVVWSSTEKTGSS